VRTFLFLSFATRSIGPTGVHEQNVLRAAQRFFHAARERVKAFDFKSKSGTRLMWHGPCFEVVANNPVG